MDDEMKLLQAENEWLHEEIKEHQEYERELQHEVWMLKKEIMDLEMSLGNALGSYDEVKENLDDAKTTISWLISEVKDLQSEITGGKS